MLESLEELMNPLGLVIVTEHRAEHGPGLFPPPSHSRHTQMFLKGRERRESDQGRIVVIAQPDLRRELWLDTQAHTFTVRPIFELATAEEKLRWQKQGAHYTQQHFIPSEEKTTYNIFVHTERMEETKKFFGYPARRYMTRKNHGYPNSAGNKQESVTDGWYLDFRHPAMPEPLRSQRTAVVHVGNEQPVIHRSGEKQYSGLPANVITTTRQMYSTPQGQKERTSKQTVEIVSLVEVALEQALFEVPKDFRERPVFPSRWNGWAQQFQNVLRRVRAA
jgi:hypothetical protein